MPLNLIKVYSELLDILHLFQAQRTNSLLGIFNRDIRENQGLLFRAKRIRPIKGEDPAMDILFSHLTTESIEEENEGGSKYKRRVFEMDRSRRLHWIRPHCDETIPDETLVFSVEERDAKKRKDVIKTYVFNTTQDYLIVLEPQRSGTDYYLLSAYYLNRKEGKKSVQKKYKKRLPNVH